MTFTIALPLFVCRTLRLIMYRHTKFGYRKLSGLEHIFWIHGQTYGRTW